MDTAWFTVHPVLNSVFHIFEPLGVAVTLIQGAKKALLFDTGFGVGNIRGEVESLTRLPLTVINSHGHFDHACGNYQFDHVFIHVNEMPVIEKYTAIDYRRRTVEKMAALPVQLPGFDAERYVHAGCGTLFPFDEETIDLGGLTVDIIQMPGHTPGSVGLLVREERLLLVGDNWNPVTWLFFPECVHVPEYIDTMRNLLALPFDYVLCPHDETLRSRSLLQRFVCGLDSLSLEASEKVVIAPYEVIDTRSYSVAGEMPFVFDAAKIL